MTTVGEPIEPDVWRWYHDVVGKGEAVIVDTWWQTENGGFPGSTLPAVQPMKPGSCGPGVLGIHPVIYDENGEEVPAGSGKAGNICIRNPWLGIFQIIWGQPERFVRTYYAKYNRDPKSTDWRDMPKTRSGKIMRRVIAAISNFADVGDTTTLANPEIVEQIQHRVQAAKLERGEVPIELTPEQRAEIEAFGSVEQHGAPYKSLPA